MIHWILDDCISLDENDHQILSSSHNHVSTQTMTTYHPRAAIIRHASGDRQDISSKNISEEIIPVSSRIQRRSRCFKPKEIRLPSPCLHQKTNDQQFQTIASRRSQSVECLALPTLGEKLTDDSGAGDLDATPTTTSVSSTSYEMVPVFGFPQTAVVLIANRYQFDSTKVHEYRMKNRKNFFKSSQPTRRNTNNNLTPTKSDNIFTRLIRVLKPSMIDQMSIDPIIRHHSSFDVTNEND